MPETLHSILTPLLSALCVLLLVLLGLMSRQLRLNAARSSELIASLRQRNDFLQTMLNTQPAPVFYKDSDGIYLGCNQSFADMLGLQIAEVVGRSVFDLAPPELARIYHQADTDLLERGGLQVYETQVRFADGRNHDVIFRKATFANREGGVGGLVGTILDISERTQMERALQQSELRFRSLFENAAIGMAILDAEGRLIEANQALGNFLGYTPEELCLMSAPEVSHPEDRAETERLYREVREGRRDQIQYEKRYLRSDGTEVWGSASIRWVRNQGGGLDHGMAILIDIDERRRAEERLRRSEESSLRLTREYKGLLDGIADPLLLLTPARKVVWANRGAAESGRRTAEEIRGLACHQICLHYSTPCPECVVRQTLESGEPASARVCGGDGRIWDMRSFPVRDEEGHVIRIIEHLQDMTETLRLQDEAARSAHLASLGELAAGVAHEINNPINGIINYAQLLGEKLAASEREADMAGRIIREGERIATIVRNLLSFARKRPEEKAPVAICEVILDAYVLAEAHLRKDGIEVVLDLPEHLPEIVAHGQQLQQVFLNLISNARYALNEKYPGRAPEKTLAISAHRFEHAGRPRLNMTFRDQGTGIPAGIRDKVLNPFFTTKPSGAGTGLGLSISHGIMADHGGALRIESQPGAWTCVTVDLPLDPAPSAIQDLQP